MSKEGENGSGVARAAVPTLTLTFDPRTYQVSVGGSVPNWDFAKYMLQTGLAETEKKIAERDRSQIARPELVTDFSNLRG